MRQAITALLILSAAAVQTAGSACPMAEHARGSMPRTSAAPAGASGEHAGHHRMAGHASPDDEARPPRHGADHSDPGCGLVLACGTLALIPPIRAPETGQARISATSILTRIDRYTTFFPAHTTPPPRLPA
jgi:hypothetical protein